ncbi:ABC transporter substrate-binding protein [Candidatus Sumerlaeota bacterium]|nr:ABC transporter substrate-binding protein [Candidatus Sumerlaeota bacterium]
MKKTVLIIFAFALFAARTFAAEDLSGIKWETDNDEPLIGSEKAIRGGTFNDTIPSYPLTFRLFGPNSNDAFANWSREYSLDIGLVDFHPTTRQAIPMLATHWSVQPDHKTVYYKLDPDARWSDGVPITADDYVFSAEFRRSPHILDPFQSANMKNYFESVEKIDDYTIKIVGKVESWRPLYDYNFSPIPKHATKLDADWVKRENNVPPVVQGPYIISDFKEGERVVFKRVPDWWGDKKRYFTGMFNPDQINLRVIENDDLDFDVFKKHESDIYQVLSARRWENEMSFDALNNGLVHRRRVFVDAPQGLSGIIFNLKNPMFANRDFRKGLQHLMNFDELNKNLMFNAYYRQYSMFTGTAYENHSLKGYPFDPKLARQYLAKAGFDKRGSDGILENAKGDKARFTLLYNSKSLERHLTVIKNAYRKGGVEIDLQLLEPGALFNKLLERAYDASLLSMTADVYPDPYQYFSTEFKDKTQNNNFWNYGNPEVDKLIDIYRYDMDETKRNDAMAELDAKLEDESLIILFWQAPYLRMLYWDDIEFPENYLPRTIDKYMDYQTFWINPEKRAKLAEALKAGTKYPTDTIVDVDPYGVKKRLVESAAAATTAVSN